jgi:hypothetical protein
MNYLYKMTLLIFLVQACSHHKIPLPHETRLVLNLVQQAYIKGCVDTHHLYKKKKVMFQCSNQSKPFIKDIFEIIK